MDQYLTDADVRVLGALIEKQVTTPDNYPLSLNALIAACNQSSNRHPVVAYDEETVLAAVQRLRRASLVRAIQRSDSRVTKYEHIATDTLDLSSNELGLMCVLMLRGPNTIGELRTRTERLARFESLADVETTLNRRDAATTSGFQEAIRVANPVVSTRARGPSCSRHERSETGHRGRVRADRRI